MNECFVIQPFDNDKFDNRYTDVFAPAIRAAGLEPYRVDKDLSTNDLVEGIKEGIDRAAVVLCDLTLDNPNVWYELGHAIAKGKPFCLICSDERVGKYPFDIGHLKVMPYKVGSLSNFTKLGEDITARLKAVYTQREQLIELSSAVELISTQDGLDPFERVALSLIFNEHLDGGIRPWDLKQAMERSGFNKSGTTLGVLNLMKKGLVEKKTIEQHDDDFFQVFNTTELGVEWIRNHRNDLVLTTRSHYKAPDYGDTGITDDDIPF